MSARVVAGIGCTHVPSIGAAIDNGKTGQPYWKPLFDGLPPAREWLADLAPDVAIVVYNDHATALSLRMIPTFLMAWPTASRRPTRVTAPVRYRWWRAMPTSPGTLPSH